MNTLDKLIKSFKENLSPEEHAQLDAWKNESEENLKAMEEFTRIHNAAKLIRDGQDFDKHAAWDNISGQIDLDDKTRIIRLHPAIKGIAVMAILVISAFFFLRNQMTTPTNEVYTAMESIQMLNLKDGTQVNLDKSSTLEVIEDRYVALQGRASFDVTTTPDVANFTIKINKGSITVLGTEFTILTTEDLLEVSVTVGHVKVVYDGRSIDLYANDILKLFEDQVTVTSNTYTNTDSWINNKLVFDDDPLTKVVHDVSIYFKQNIVFDKSIKDPHNCPYTSKFNDPKLDEVLQELRIIFNAEIIKQGNSYVIRSINC
jgi:ferric-dicitrate binding protein FerR (iron transport regulator)